MQRPRLPRRSEPGKHGAEVGAPAVRSAIEARDPGSGRPAEPVGPRPSRPVRPASLAAFQHRAQVEGERWRRQRSPGPGSGGRRSIRRGRGLGPSKARSRHHAQWCAQGGVVPAVKKERRPGGCPLRASLESLGYPSATPATYIRSDSSSPAAPRSPRLEAQTGGGRATPPMRSAGSNPHRHGAAQVWRARGSGPVGSDAPP